MGAGRPVDPPGEAWRPASDGGHSGGPERHLLRALDQVPVEGAAEGSAAPQHRLGVPDLWDWDGTLGRIHHALYVEVREKVGREASPTTAIIDSQTAKGAQGASLDP